MSAYTSTPIALCGPYPYEVVDAVMIYETVVHEFPQFFGRFASFGTPPEPCAFVFIASGSFVERTPYHGDSCIFKQLEM